MTGLRALIAVIVTLLLLALVDLGADRLAANSVPRQTMRAIATAPARIDVLGIGNSLIAAGFAPPAVARGLQVESRSVVNGALGASGLIEHLALTRLALRGHEVRILVYGYFDQQMSTDVPEREADLIGNRAMLFLEPDLVRLYAHFSLMDQMAFEIHRSLALFRERSTLWTKVERVRRTIGALGLPAEETDVFGRRADFSKLEATSTAQFEMACERALRADVLAPPLRALVEQSRAQGTRVVVVEMPAHPRHRQRFYSAPTWTRYEEATKAAVEALGAEHVDASDWIDSEERFEDPLHLDAAGAEAFSERLDVPEDHERASDYGKGTQRVLSVV